MANWKPGTSGNSSGGYYRGNNGVGFVGLLTLLFIGLKLTGFIDWPWLWVLAPIWLSIALWIIIIGLALAAAIVVHVLDKYANKGE